MYNPSTESTSSLQDTQGDMGNESLYQTTRNPSISKKLLECDVLRSSTIRHSQIEDEVFTPAESNECDNDAVIRVSVHSQDNMDISIVNATTVKHDRTVIASVEEEVQTVEEYARDYAPLVIIKSLPPYEYISNANLPPLLGPKDNSKQLTLVLDLDETLVHCSMEPLQDCHYVFPMFYHGNEMKVYARIRPYAKQLLEYCSSFCEIVIFTASVPEYANTIINLLDEQNKFVSYRLFREHCTFVNGVYVKDLSRLGRDLNQTVIVDNSMVCFAYHLNNGIPISSWFDNWEDRELYSLAMLIRNLVIQPNIPLFLEDSFHLQTILDAVEIPYH